MVGFNFLVGLVAFLGMVAFSVYMYGYYVCLGLGDGFRLMLWV